MRPMGHGVFRHQGFTNDQNLDGTGVAALFFDPGGHLTADLHGLQIVDLLAVHEDPQLATTTEHVGIGDAGEAVSDVLQNGDLLVVGLDG